MPAELADLIPPSWHAAPAYDFTDGDLVAELLAGCRDDKGPYILDPEQRLVLDDWFGYARTPRGPKLAAFEGAVVACRQNMKTGVLKAAALGKIYVSEQRLVVWSAHEFFASREAFRDLKILIESNPDMDAEVQKIWTGAGAEAIEFTGDRRLIFKARTNSSGRSLSGDTVILDEAFALQPEHIASLAPTLAARPDPQMLYGSSAGLLSSSVLRAIRDRGRAKVGRLAYAEWAGEFKPCLHAECDHAVGSEGCSLDDEGLWRQGNTAIARGRMTVETIAGLRQANAAEPMKFAREQIGWWDDPGADGALQPIDGERFAKLVGPGKIQSPVFALDVSPRRTWACIVAAGEVDGRVLVEIPSAKGVKAYQRGTAWVVRTFGRLAKRFPGAVVRLLSKAQAVTFAPALEELGFTVDYVSMGDYPGMCAALAQRVDEGSLMHRGELELTAAVDAAIAVEVGEEQWRWGRRKSGGDIAPLVAMTLAASGTGDDYDVLDSIG